MEVLLLIVLASLLNGMVAFVGAFSLFMSEKNLEKIIIMLVAFSAGSLLGGSFFHIIKESLEIMPYEIVINYFVIGFIAFFVVERVLFWHHCHEKECETHPFSYLILVGDAIHNFIDGIILASAFLTDVALGITTTLIIILHEIPQELGDFGVLVYGGFNKKKALIYNFFSQITCLAGALLAYFFYSKISIAPNLLLPFAAGGFVYIAASDLIPELHKEKDVKKAAISMILFIAGLVLIKII